MHLPRLLAATTILIMAIGCHSAFIDADLVNRTSSPITLVELDYPSASFGTQTLLPSQHYKYRFKILGSGNLKLIYTDAARHEITTPGPTLNEGEEGPLTITVTPTGVLWAPPTRR